MSNLGAAAGWGLAIGGSRCNGGRGSVDGTAVTTATAAGLHRVVEVDAHEGPVYVPSEQALYFTTLPPRVQIKRLALRGSLRVTVVRDDANRANGMALDRDGRRLVVCEQGSLDQPARLTRFDPRTGAVETLVEEVDGQPLNSPNDVVVARDGALWFTDPSYGHLQGFRPAPAVPDRVYRHDPRTGRTAPVADDLDKPNGIALSPGERTLYVGDSGANQEPGSFHPDRPHHVMAYDVVGSRVANGRVFAVVEPGFPDGLKVDAAGRVYVSSGSGVEIYSPGGDHLARLRLPGAVNFAWGGIGHDVLFITADSAVHAAAVGAIGYPRHEEQ
jgi:gluconolactonase